MTLEQLEENTINWATERQFFCPTNGTTPEKQFLKLAEEAGEIAGNLARGICVKDDIGDCLVVLTNLARLTGTNLTECFQIAYNDIKERKGEMINGVFVKESDLEKQKITIHDGNLTGEQYFSFIPDELKERFKNYRIKHYSNKTYQDKQIIFYSDFYTYFFRSFRFSETEEKENFWLDLFEKLTAK
jgi:NTP pyrophosphatase (non-canonical NTP hydrolase)